jgi:3-phosphoshikimate 1-carboxyvinyltransferase
VSKQKISPAKTISGAVEVPGDKSISHRYAILASLASGPSEIAHFSAADDCHRTLECFRRMGIEVDQRGDSVRVSGAPKDGLRAPRRTLDAGNSGTTMRLLAGVLAGQKFRCKLDGDGSLRRRPMRRVIDPLTRMGAKIASRNGGTAPLEIEGTPLHAIEYKLPVASAQVKSAILLAGLFAAGETSAIEEIPTRDHTELALEEFGAEVIREGRAIRISGGAHLEGRKLTVPGDLSSAAFFLAAALILPGSNMLVHEVGLNPTRTAVLDAFARMGGAVKPVSIRVAGGELIGDLSVSYAPLTGGVIEGAEIANLIDELPVLAALGPYTEQGIEIRNAEELRVKESDRIAAIVENLRRMGATVDERPDGLRVEGRRAGRLRGAKIETRGDHRMAMAFAVAALGAVGTSVIDDAQCAAVSYPDFFATLERLVER